MLVPSRLVDQPLVVQGFLRQKVRAKSVALVELADPSFPAPGAYHHRNQKIVDRVDLLLLFPANVDAPAGGTRSAKEKAEKKGIPMYVFGPSGRVEQPEPAQAQLPFS